MTPTAPQKPAPGRFADTMAQLWTGFHTPSLVALGLMALTFTATTVAAIFCITPSLLAGQFGTYLARDFEDDAGFVTHEAYRLASPETRPGSTKRVSVLGNSIIGQAFANGERLDDDLDRLTHHNWDVTMLTTGQQGPLDEAALVDYATKQDPGIVVLPIGFDRFESDPAEIMKYYRLGRIGIRSDLADYQARHLVGSKPRRRVGVLLFDNRNFFIRNGSIIALRAAFRQAPERRVDVYIFRHNAEKLKSYRRDLMKFLKHNYQHGELATNLLKSTTDTVKSRGGRVVFFQPPLAPNLFQTAAERHRYAVHLAKSAALAKELGGYYCHPSAAAHPPTEAFADFFHLKDPKWQARLRVVLARCIADAAQEGKQS